MTTLKAWDADGHVEEWERTFSDDYLEPKFRDRRPKIVHPEGSSSFLWQVAGREDLYKVGGSPTAMNGVPSREQVNLIEWRGSVESSEVHTPEDRFKVLDAEDTELQINYPTMFLGHPVSYDLEYNWGITRSYNNWIADISSQAPERLKWVTVIDPRDVKESVREIERTKDMGSVGIMVHGVYGNKTIDDEEFEPIWAAARDTGLPLAVHPGMVAFDLQETHRPFADIQFKYSVLMGFNRIMVSGILDRFPTVKVGFLETGCGWAEFCLYAANEYIETVYQRRNAGLPREPFTGRSVDLAVSDLRPEEYMKRGQVFIGFEVEEDVISYLVDKYGPDCWLYASDIPHGHRVINAPHHFAERTDLSDVAKRKLLKDNTAAFYGLDLNGSSSN